MRPAYDELGQALDRFDLRALDLEEIGEGLLLRKAGGKETTMATSSSSSAERVCNQRSPAANSDMVAGIG